MKILKQFYIFLFVIILSSSSFLFSMGADEGVDESNFIYESDDSLLEDTFDFDYDPSYDSDSEDEANYRYKGFSDFDIPEHLRGRRCLVIFRGIHFSGLSKEYRSYLRKTTMAGENIYSSAIYDVSGIGFEDRYLSSQDLASQDLPNNDLVENAIEVRNKITSLSFEDRNRFQTLYVNQYKKFHSQLEAPTSEFEEIFDGFESSQNPQLSFSEELLHPYKYAFGQKSSMRSDVVLEPEYDDVGNPKHPYLGEIYVVMIPIDEIEEIDPYFVVSSYARNEIFVSTYPRKNILSEREVTIPGFIDGRYVVYNKAVRVPSFAWGEYQPYYAEKYNVTNHSFKIQQTKLRNHNFQYKNMIEKVFKHNSIKLMEHIVSVCVENDVTIVYRDFDLRFVTELPNLELAKENRRRLIEED